MKRQVGIVTITYNKLGIVEKATFKPTMEINSDSNVLSQLQQLKSANSGDVLKQNADLVLGSWFNVMTEIELADRDLFKIESEVVSCTKFDGLDLVQECQLNYFFTEI